jgi:hypothetical protein
VLLAQLDTLNRSLVLVVCVSWLMEMRMGERDEHRSSKGKGYR